MGGAKRELGSALTLLKDLDFNKSDLTLSISSFARCHKLFLQEQDVNGFFWSITLLQGILHLTYPNLDHDGYNSLFVTLLSSFDSEIQAEEESGRALAAYHVACKAGEETGDSEIAMIWFVKCQSEAKTDFLRYEAASGLGRVLLKKLQPEEALQWFQVARICARSNRSLDSSAIASYQIGKTLLMLGRFEEAVQQLDDEKGLFASALITMLDESKALIGFTEARTKLTSFMPNLEHKLASYLGSSCCSCMFLLKFTKLDRFNKYLILSEAQFPEADCTREEAVQIERFIFAFQLYTDSRNEMIRIYPEDKLLLATKQDPRPYLEQGIEFLYSHNNSELPLALDPLIICHQISLRLHHSTCIHYLGIVIGHWIEYHREEGAKPNDLSLSLSDGFRKHTYDGDENPEAWAAFYLGKVDSNENLLKRAFKLGHTNILKIHAAKELGDAATSVSSRISHYELMKKHAMQSNEEDVLIGAFSTLFHALMLSGDYEKAHNVQQEFMTLLPTFLDATFGQAIAEFMEARICVTLTYRLENAKKAHKKFMATVESLGGLIYPPVKILRRYLATAEDFWSFVKNSLLHFLYNISSGIVGSRQSDPYAEIIRKQTEYLTQYQCLDDLMQQVWLLTSEKKFEEAEGAAAYMLQVLEEVNDEFKKTPAYSRYAALARVSLARIASSYKPQGEDKVTMCVEVAETLLEEALTLASRDSSTSDVYRQILFHHSLLLAELGQITSAIEKMEIALRSWLTADPKLGSFSTGRIFHMDGLAGYFRVLQELLWKNNDFQKALIWHEREHARDMLYSMERQNSQHTYSKKLAEFDADDGKAWEEIQSVSEMMGHESVIIVVTGQPVKGYLLHLGGVFVPKDLNSSSPLASITDVLKLISTISISQYELLLEHHLIEYHDMLIKPFVEQLEHIKPKRIIFVAYEELCTFPFAALFDQSSESFLIENYAVSSVSSLRMLRHCELRRLQLTFNGKEQKSGLVVGNPTMNLAYASKEANFITEILKQANFTEVIKLQRKEAKKELVLNFLHSSDWIHIASHGIVNANFPDGALMFHQGDGYDSDDDGDNEVDEEELVRTLIKADSCAMLTGDEISKEGPVFKANAVFLSACRSGLGRVFSEGILALPRSFHICGVPSAVISLWNIPDDSTTHLMQQLYLNLLTGMQLDAALQNVIIEMTKVRDCFGLPVYSPKSWAPFIISGTPFTTLVDQAHV